MIKVYGCKDYDGDKLVANYIPCENAEGVEGMYDTISKKFIDKHTYARMMLERLKRAEEINIISGGEKR